MIYPVFALASLATALPQVVRPPFQVGQRIVTTSGTVVGQASSWQPNVSEYLGIPYARPPVEQLRFAAPKAFKSNGTIQATKFSPDCPANVASAPGSKIEYNSVAQTIGGILGQAGDEFSEDCLTINVWSRPQAGEKAKAVMIWIYVSAKLSYRLYQMRLTGSTGWWLQYRKFTISSIQRCTSSE